jgi:hypothetical protein
LNRQRGFDGLSDVEIDEFAEALVRDLTPEGQFGVLRAIRNALEIK